MQGAPMRGVQELARHQSLAMTQRYPHLSPSALDATIRLLEHRPTQRAVGDSVEAPMRIERVLRLGAHLNVGV